MAISQHDNAGPMPTTHGSNDLEWLLDDVPGVREAIQQRLAENSDYRVWMEQFGRTVLHAVT